MGKLGEEHGVQEPSAMAILELTLKNELRIMAFIQCEQNPKGVKSVTKGVSTSLND